MQDEPPILRVAIGHKIAEVEVKSHLDFDLAGKNDDTPQIIEEAVRVEYDDPHLWVQLPATRFVWISQQAGIVTEFETSPQLEALSLEAAHELATQLADLITGAHWQLTHRPPVDLNQIKTAVMTPERQQTYELLYGEWIVGTVRVRLTLRESGRGLPQQEHTPRFVVNLRWQDKVLQDKMRQVVYHARKEVNGNIHQPLPLRYHLSQ